MTKSEQHTLNSLATYLRSAGEYSEFYWAKMGTTVFILYTYLERQACANPYQMLQNGDIRNISNSFRFKKVPYMEL